MVKKIFIMSSIVMSTALFADASLLEDSKLPRSSRSFFRTPRQQKSATIPTRTAITNPVTKIPMAPPPPLPPRDKPQQPLTKEEKEELAQRAASAPLPPPLELDTHIPPAPPAPPVSKVSSSTTTMPTPPPLPPRDTTPRPLTKEEKEDLARRAALAPLPAPLELDTHIPPAPPAPPVQKIPESTPIAPTPPPLPPRDKPQQPLTKEEKEDLARRAALAPLPPPLELDAETPPAPVVLYPPKQPLAAPEKKQPINEQLTTLLDTIQQQHSNAFLEKFIQSSMDNPIEATEAYYALKKYCAENKINIVNVSTAWQNNIKKLIQKSTLTEDKNLQVAIQKEIRLFTSYLARIAQTQLSWFVISGLARPVSLRHVDAPQDLASTIYTHILLAIGKPAYFMYKGYENNLYTDYDFNLISYACKAQQEIYTLCKKFACEPQLEREYILIKQFSASRTATIRKYLSWKTISDNLSLFEAWIGLPGTSSHELSLLEQAAYIALRQTILTAKSTISALPFMEKVVWLLVRAQKTNALFRKSDVEKVTESMRIGADNTLANKIQNYYSELLQTKRSMLDAIQTFGNITLRDKFRYPGTTTVEKSYEQYHKAIKNRDLEEIKKAIFSYIQYAPLAKIEELLAQYANPSLALQSDIFEEDTEDKTSKQTEELDIDDLRREIELRLKNSTEPFSNDDVLLFKQFVSAGAFQKSPTGSVVSKASGGMVNVKTLIKLINVYTSTQQALPAFLVPFK